MSPQFFRPHVERQPPNLDPERRVGEIDVVCYHSPLPSLEEEEVVFKIPWSIRLHPLNLKLTCEFDLENVVPHFYYLQVWTNFPP